MSTVHHVSQYVSETLTLLGDRTLDNGRTTNLNK